MNLSDYINLIEPLDESMLVLSQKRWDNIAKPLKSLGKLEKAVSRMAAISQKNGKVDISKPALLVMCGDHGVVCEGVTQIDSSVTKIVADSFQNSETTVTVMSKFAGVDVFPVDVGINCDTYENKELLPFKVCDRKIKKGTENILLCDAMTNKECEKAVLTGIECVKELKEKGYNIIATGEMGIGNTTPSSVLAAIYTGLNAKEATGKGAGLSKEGYNRKIQVVDKTINRVLNNYKKEDYLGVISACSGLEIAALTGVFLGGAVYKVPVVCDGLISTVAALMAEKIAPLSKNYISGSHISAEPSVNAVIKTAGIETYIDCQMCLGEGTGAVAVIPLFQMACDVYNKMSTFEDFKMENYKDYEKE